MKRAIIILLLLANITVFAQTEQKDVPTNAAGKLLSSNDKLTIGGYAQIDYNQPFGGDTRENGKLDVHRLVMLLGYKFNDRTQFVTEIEYEHVKEVYVEQAFLNYQIKPWLSLRGGLMLVPMGRINEYHEPTTYNGVERPNLDSKIVPTTWREIGLGFNGNLTSANLKYQVYLMNGFKSYDKGGILRGTDAFRKGRQKGVESIMSSPNLALKTDYYGISGLKVGLSGYFGKTQSSLYDGIDKDDSYAEAVADSSVVGISMIGLDANYNINGWEFRGQYNYASISNSDEYNAFTGKDLGCAIMGWYLEGGYNLFHHSTKIKDELVPFVRYEKYNTHQDTDGIDINNAYDRTDITAGIGWKMAKGAVLKADIQWKKNAVSGSSTGKQFNMGVGIWF